MIVWLEFEFPHLLIIGSDDDEQSVRGIVHGNSSLNEGPPIIYLFSVIYMKCWSVVLILIALIDLNTKRRDQRTMLLSSIDGSVM